MNEGVQLFFQVFIYALIVAIVMRSLLSWFPISRGNSFTNLVYQVTEPLLAPVRRMLPRTSFLDFSAMLVIVLLWLMLMVVNRAAER